MSGCAVQCGVCCAACARYIVGKILWWIISCPYERLSVESRVLDASQRRRHCCCCRLMSAFILHLEEGCTWVEGSDCMAVLYMRCCCRAVWLLRLHAAAELCRVLGVFAGPGCATMI